MNLETRIQPFFTEQLEAWELARNNFRSLRDVKVRTFDFGTFRYKVQFNPARAVSSGAKLDAQSIRERPCFLCKENRPEVQKSIDYNERFEICVNPYPILEGHLTIISKQHTRQAILPYYNDMLCLAKDLDRHIIFYNGPKAGASAPDHMHFQAAPKKQLPLETDHKNVPGIVRNLDGDAIRILNGYLRTCILFESDSKISCERTFQNIYGSLPAHEDEEPIINLFCWYENNKWITAVFPRKTHRPSQFFSTANDHMMISPGAIDMAGILILPVQKDFENISKEIMKNVMQQVSLNYDDNV